MSGVKFSKRRAPRQSDFSLWHGRAELNTPQRGVYLEIRRETRDERREKKGVKRPVLVQVVIVVVLDQGIILGVDGLGTIVEHGQESPIHWELVINPSVIGAYIVLVAVIDVPVSVEHQNSITIAFETQRDGKRPAKRTRIVAIVFAKIIVIAFLSVEIGKCSLVDAGATGRDIVVGIATSRKQQRGKNSNENQATFHIYLQCKIPERIGDPA